MVKLKAALKHWDKLLGWVIVVVPEYIIVDDLLSSRGSAFPDPFEVEDIVLAVVNHLLGDLYEEASHTVVSVVVPGDGMDHLDAVHECGECVLDGVGSTFIEGLNELLKSGQILDVVLSLVECLSYSELDAAPLGGG